MPQSPWWNSYTGQTTVLNGSETVLDAPINYMQIWDGDIRYAAGRGNCTSSSCPPGCATQTNMPTFYVPPGNGVSGGQMTAKQMLTLANHTIHKFTSLPASGLPVGHCIDKSLVPRGAFQGDPVCDTQKEANDVTTDNNNAAAGKTYLSSSNFTDKTFYNGSRFVPSVPNNIVPYGNCTSGLEYRQAYMGDYVCVTNKQAKQVKADSEEGPPLLPE